MAGLGMRKLGAKWQVLAHNRLFTAVPKLSALKSGVDVLQCRQWADH